MLRLMDRPAATQLTLTLQLQLDADGFAGRADDDLGAGRAFSGWLGLIAALDELIDTAPARRREQRERDRPDDSDASPGERGVETSC
jgi:hypothetical protein